MSDHICTYTGRMDCPCMTKSETDAAKLLGRKGGLSKSEAKQAAARENGKKNKPSTACPFADHPKGCACQAIFTANRGRD